MNARVAWLLCLIVLVLAACQGSPVGLPLPSSPATFTPPPTRTPLPTHTPLPTATPFPTATETPFPTPTIAFPLLVGTPFSFQPDPISVENASRLAELARWQGAIEGSSSILQLAFTSDGSSLAVLKQWKESNNVVFSSGTGQDVVCHEVILRCADLENGEHQCNYNLRFLSLLDGIPRDSIAINPGIGDRSLKMSSNCETFGGVMIEGGCPIQFFSVSESAKKWVINPSISPIYYGLLANGDTFWIGDVDGHINAYNTANGNLILQVALDVGNLDIIGKWKLADSPIINKYAYETTCRKKNGGDYSQILSMSPDGKYLVTRTNKCATAWFTNASGVTKTGSDVARIDLWRVEGEKLIHTLGNPISCERNCLGAFSPDGALIATKTDATPIQVFNTLDGRRIQEIGDPEASYDSLTFTADGQVLFAVRGDAIELWGVAEGNLLTSLSVIASQTALSHDGRYLATVTEDGLIQIWGIAP
jgi:WD40 repeat protein